MRALYSVVFYSIIPFILIRLLWRSIKAPAYRRRWKERFGFYPEAYSAVDIWFHAVSVGEAEALFPLIRKLQQNHPDARLLISATTPTGSARIKTVLKDSVYHVYLPYDIPAAVERFMKHFKPAIAVILETEIWPNLFACCGKYKVPLYIINARLSENSTKGYRKIRSLIQPALAQVKLIGAQTQDDAERFIAIGANIDTVEILGNIKFDVQIPQTAIEQGKQIKSDLFKDRFVWLVASTHKDEEAIFLEVYDELKDQIPEILLVIAPRHPERFNEVKKLCEKRHNVATRGAADPVQAGTDIYLADTMGELKLLYAAADIAFVGGSMAPYGGHNILEAAAAGTPVMFGPHMTNFKQIAMGILKQNAAIQCLNKKEICDAILRLYGQPDQRAQLIKKAKGFLALNQGAMDKIYAAIVPDIEKIA